MAVQKGGTEMKNKEQSTRDILGIKRFSRVGLETENYGELAYLAVRPTNISVLSRSSISTKIHHLTDLLSAQPDIEIICTDAKESFEENKLNLTELAESEKNRKVRDLISRDIFFLDEIQIEMSTSREFLFVIRFRDESAEQSLVGLNRIEKMINEQGFECSRLGREDIKRILSRYLGVMTADRQIGDNDGDNTL